MARIPILHLALLVASTLTTAALAIYAWYHRTGSGALPLSGLMSALSVYSFAHLLGMLTADPGWRFLFERVQWSAAAWIPVCWLLFALAYTGHDELLDRKTTGALALIPFITVLLTWTNPSHGLMWEQDATVMVVDGLAIVEQPFGPWIYPFTSFAYGAITVGMVLLLRLIWRSGRLYMSQALSLIVGITVPVLANAVTLLGLSPVKGLSLDMMPYVFSITGLTFGYALYRHRLLEYAPAIYRIGRNASIRDLGDGVVIVDTARRVVYCNSAAAELLDCDPADLTGEPIQSVIGKSALTFDVEPTFAELTLNDSVFELRASPICNRYDRLIGHTLLIQNITDRKHREQQLQRQRDDLQQLEELNAVLRGVNKAIVSATSREELERTVCDRVTDSDLYQTACAANVATWNGDANRWTVAGTNDGAVPQMAESCDGETRLEDRPELLDHLSFPDDQQSRWIVVPVVCGETVYGALGLHAADGQFTDRSTLTQRKRAVLAELGEIVGHAIEAIENRRLLAAESVVELVLRNDDEDGAIARAAAAADCQLRMTGFLPDASHGHIAYVSVVDGSVETVADALATNADTRARPIRERNGSGLVEWIIPADTIIGVLVEHSAHIMRVTASNGTTRYEVEVPSDADVRDLVDDVQRAFPETQLEAKRELKRPIERADTIPADTIEDLTERQRESLETAYRAGYYEWPRESTAEEVAATLDITAPTLHAHLRKSEATLLDPLFDRDPLSRK